MELGKHPRAPSPVPPAGGCPCLPSRGPSGATGGKEAMGEATVRIENEAGRTFIGRGVSTDIIEASAKAYVDAINRMVASAANSEETKIEL